jgi:translation initiation factor IF-3
MEKRRAPTPRTVAPNNNAVNLPQHATATNSRAFRTYRKRDAATGRGNSVITVDVWRHDVVHLGLQRLPRGAAVSSACPPFILGHGRAHRLNVPHSGGAEISKPVRVNERIRIREVRLIDEEGQQLGIVPTFQALQTARERGLDLVEVAPNAVPPVCRIMDWGKERYEQSRKERESRRNSKAITIKEIRLKPKTDDHDLDTKTRKAKEFLQDGDKVKLTVLFRGRENLHPEVGRALLDRMLDQLGQMAIIEATPRLEGRNMTAMLAPKKVVVPAVAAAPRAAAPTEEVEEAEVAEEPAPTS